MSILNITSDGLPSVLVVLFKFLQSHGSTDSEALINLCAPKSISDQEQARQTLKTWTEIGLFEIRDNLISISSGVLKKHKNDVRTTVLPCILRDLIFSKTNNERFWDTESSKSADFTRAICWVLAQDIYSFPGSGYQEVSVLEGRQFTNKNRAFQNDTRWFGFKAWATFLGFCWISRYPKNNTLVIDPTVALRDVLPEIFRGKHELPQSEFFRKTANTLSVFDGGRYRKEVEGMLSNKTWRKPKDNEISTSLTRAIERLRVSAVLKVEDRADAEKKHLLGREGTTLRKVSHFILLGGHKL